MKAGQSKLTNYANNLQSIANVFFILFQCQSISLAIYFTQQKKCTVNYKIGVLIVLYMLNCHTRIEVGNLFFIHQSNFSFPVQQMISQSLSTFSFNWFTRWRLLLNTSYTQVYVHVFARPKNFLTFYLHGHYVYSFNKTGTEKM